MLYYTSGSCQGGRIVFDSSHLTRPTAASDRYKGLSPLAVYLETKGSSFG